MWKSPLMIWLFPFVPFHQPKKKQNIDEHFGDKSCIRYMYTWAKVNSIDNKSVHCPFDLMGKSNSWASLTNEKRMSKGDCLGHYIIPTSFNRRYI